jgi:hypothetical protein
MLMSDAGIAEVLRTMCYREAAAETAFVPLGRSAAAKIPPEM